MTVLKYVSPSVGEKNVNAEPKVDTALNEIKTVVNGEINSENIAEKGVEKSRLSETLQTELSSFVGLPLESKKSIVATEQGRTSASYGVLTTPDEVSVVMATNGLIAVAYQAMWKQSVATTARAAIFVGTNQLKVISGSGPVVQEAAMISNTAAFFSLATGQGGLVSSENPNYSGDVTTGQIIGADGTNQRLMGPLMFFAVAGTYKITVQFKASSGTVTAKERKLWAWAIG
jgi:hypothetical protein